MDPTKMPWENNLSFTVKQNTLVYNSDGKETYPIHAVIVL